MTQSGGKKKKVRIRTGDIFQFPVDDKCVGYGQIVETKNPHVSDYTVILEPLFPAGEEQDFKKVVASRVFAVAGVVTVDIEDGDWPIVANLIPDYSMIPFHYFKVNHAWKRVVVDFIGNIIREATETDWNFYEHPFSVGSANIVRAFRAYHGLEPWKEWFNRYTYEYAKSRSVLLTPDGKGVIDRPPYHPVYEEEPTEAKEDESSETVILHLKLSDDKYGTEKERSELWDFQDALGKLLGDAGMVDGDEFGGGRCEVYIYGASNDEMLRRIRPALRKWKARQGSYVQLGNDDDSETTQIPWQRS